METPTQAIKDFLTAADRGYLGSMPSGFNDSAFVKALRGQTEGDVEMSPVDRAALIAYADANREIPDSDLDDKQPITLTIRTTLGEIRRLQRAHRNLTEVVIPSLSK